MKIIIPLLIAVTLVSCTSDGKIDRAKAAQAVNAAGNAALQAYLAGGSGKAIKSAALASGAAVLTAGDKLPNAPAPTDPLLTAGVEAPVTATK